MPPNPVAPFQDFVTFLAGMGFEPFVASVNKLRGGGSGQRGAGQRIAQPRAQAIPPAVPSQALTQLPQLLQRLQQARASGPVQGQAGIPGQPQPVANPLQQLAMLQLRRRMQGGL